MPRISVTFSPRPVISAGRLFRQAVTSERRRAAMPARAEGESPPGLALASNLKAGAASAEPPPRPAATGRAFTRRKRKVVAELGEGHETTHRVEAVGAAAEHLESEIELGSSSVAERRHRKGSARRS